MSFALAKYVRATGDIEFLYREGVDIAVETARLWATLGFWRTSDGDGEESFHIHGVTGPDEYTTVVNDNLFTNVMARFNLRFAARTVREMAEDDPEAYRLMVDRLGLDPAEAEAWERAAEAMHIPFSPALGIHPQDAVFLEREVWDLEHTPADQRPLLLHFHPLVIYRYQVLKQADVVLALFLQGNHFSDEDKLADFEYYDPLTTGDSTLSAVVQAILAAEVGYQDLALEYFRAVDLRRPRRPAPQRRPTACTWPRRAACGRRSSAASAACATTSASSSFDPRLPADWPELSYTLHWHGTPLQRHPHARRAARAGRRGRPARVQRARRRATPSARAKRSSCRSPARVRCIAGRPSLKQFADVRREDGTLLSASVPTVTTTIPIIGAGADVEHGADA